MTSQEGPKANEPNSRKEETEKKIGWGLFAVFGSGLALWLILPTVAVLFILVALASRSCVRSCTAPRVSISPIHGLVIDAATGQALQGARVMRVFYHEAKAEFETTSPYPMKESLASVATDPNGRFTLPGTETISTKGVRGLSGMAWVVWKPGWMPTYDCYFQDDWAPGRCSPFAGMQDLDPWSETTFQAGGSQLGMEVRIFSPAQQGIKRKEHDAAGRVILSDRVHLGPDGRAETLEPWGEYFSRLNHLVQDRYLTTEEFVRQAQEFADKHEMTLKIRNEFAQVRGSLGYMLDEGGYFKPDQALLLLTIEEQYCARHPEEKGCDTTLLARDRAWLEEKISINRR